MSLRPVCLCDAVPHAVRPVRRRTASVRSDDLAAVPLRALHESGRGLPQ